MGRMTRFRVAIRAGHGGEDRGAVHDRLDEADLNYLLTVDVMQALTGTGYDVRLVRMGDETLSLEEGNDRMLPWRPHLVVEIHHNASHSGYVRGMEIYHWPENHPTELLCHVAASACPVEVRTEKVFAATDLPGEHDDWMLPPRAILGAYDSPSILVEACYLTNALDVSYLAQRRSRQALATCIRAPIVRASDLLGGNS